METTPEGSGKKGIGSMDKKRKSKHADELAAVVQRQGVSPLRSMKDLQASEPFEDPEFDEQLAKFKASSGLRDPLSS